MREPAIAELVKEASTMSVRERDKECEKEAVTSALKRGYSARQIFLRARILEIPAGQSRRKSFVPVSPWKGHANKLGPPEFRRKCEAHVQTAGNSRISLFQVLRVYGLTFWKGPGCVECSFAEITKRGNSWISFATKQVTRLVSAGHHVRREIFIRARETFRIKNTKRFLFRITYKRKSLRELNGSYKVILMWSRAAAIHAKFFFFLVISIRFNLLAYVRACRSFPKEK